MLKSSDYTLLERLRTRFLNNPDAAGDYWSDAATLAAYDTTFAERIGWKWDAVLSELRSRNWTPPAGTTLIDWGCGSGVAGRRAVEAFGAAHFSKLLVHDRSTLAQNFAADRARTRFPELSIDEISDAALGTLSEPFTLVASHVFNELAPQTRAQFLSLARRASAILWVEPGTHEVASALVSFREVLRESFRVIAPCTHQNTCGLSAPENRHHWCHHFAHPPVEAFTSAAWSEFSRRLSIDLRSLAYAFLILDRRQNTFSENWARILGDAREYRGHLKLLSCENCGVCERMLQKRDAAALYKQVRKNPLPPLYRWTLEAERIVDGTHWRDASQT